MTNYKINSDGTITEALVSSMSTTQNGETYTLTQFGNKCAIKGFFIGMGCMAVGVGIAFASVITGCKLGHKFKKLNTEE